jgi:hypothetical protein
MQKMVDGHRKGLTILRDEFGYNEMFRRPGDTFGVQSSFRPRKATF